MENLKELNRLCQKKDYRTKGNWMACNITRPMALPISWVLLHTPVTANQVTFISLLIGVCGCILFSQGTGTAMLGGAVLLQIWYLFDHVDGHIARYRKQSSLTGVYFDYITHYIIHAGIFIGIGYGTAKVLKDMNYAIWGFVAGISIVFFYLVYDVLYKTYYTGIIKREKLNVRKKNGSGAVPSDASAAKMKKMFSIAHKICEVHVLMNFITVLALVCFFTGLYPWGAFTVFYAILTVFLALIKNAHFILFKVPDVSFNDIFEVNDES